MYLIPGPDLACADSTNKPRQHTRNKGKQFLHILTIAKKIFLGSSQQDKQNHSKVNSPGWTAFARLSQTVVDR
jgi:hypothetical protein